MKNQSIFLLSASLLLASCALFSCGSLTSTTYIDPSKSFVLGEGKHGKYNARVTNIGDSPVEVFLTPKNGAITSLGVLQKNEGQFYPVSNDATVRFSNLGNEKAVISIKATGDTQLSMGYKDNN